ncbi:MAG: transcriptional regulator [Lewinellaceae bacterium]|nr:transcriptional regulator [Anaerolineales bacterium]MCB9297387.1 transcriptional regulator [Lewinellaceae bacterium]
MKDFITKLNKIFDNRLRLGIMSILLVNDDADFNRLKTMLEATDGNLASHLRALEKEGYIKVHKQFVGRKPNTTYEVTAPGRRAFSEHLDALEKILNTSRAELSSEDE